MWLLIAFLAVPLIEIALFIQVGGVIGLWPTLAIVVVTAILGAWMVRAQGIMAMNNLRTTFSRLEDPTEPLAHGAMILISGALLLTPGFFTDGIGFALLLPSVRRGVYRFLRNRIHVQRFEMGPDGPNRRRGPEGGDVIDADYQEVDPHPKPTHSAPSAWTRH